VRGASSITGALGTSTACSVLFRLCSVTHIKRCPCQTCSSKGCSVLFRLKMPQRIFSPFHALTPSPTNGSFLSERNASAPLPDGCTLRPSSPRNSPAPGGTAHPALALRTNCTFFYRKNFLCDLTGYNSMRECHVNLPLPDLRQRAGGRHGELGTLKAALAL
jgi:hypothetical protein